MAGKENCAPAGLRPADEHLWSLWGETAAASPVKAPAKQGHRHLTSFDSAFEPQGVRERVSKQAASAAAPSAEITAKASLFLTQCIRVKPQISNKSLLYELACALQQQQQPLA